MVELSVQSGQVCPWRCACVAEQNAENRPNCPLLGLFEVLRGALSDSLAASGALLGQSKRLQGLLLMILTLFAISARAAESDWLRFDAPCRYEAANRLIKAIDTTVHRRFGGSYTWGKYGDGVAAAVRDLEQFDAGQTKRKAAWGAFMEACGTDIIERLVRTPLEELPYSPEAYRLKSIAERYQALDARRLKQLRWIEYLRKVSEQ